MEEKKDTRYINKTFWESPSKEDEWYQNISTVIKPHNNMHLRAETTLDQARKPIETVWRKGIVAERWPTQILQMLRKRTWHCKMILLPNCFERDRRPLYQDRLVVLDYMELQLRLMYAHHYRPAARHSGWSKALEFIRKKCYWQGMPEDMERFLKKWYTCKRARTARHTPFGVLRLLLIHQRRWEDILMDYLLGLSWSKR